MKKILVGLLAIILSGCIGYQRPYGYSNHRYYPGYNNWGNQHFEHEHHEHGYGHWRHGDD